MCSIDRRRGGKVIIGGLLLKPSCPQFLRAVSPAVGEVDGQPHGQPDQEPDPGGQGELHHEVDVDKDGEGRQEGHQRRSEGELFLIARLKCEEEYEKSHEDSSSHSKGKEERVKELELREVVSEDESLDGADHHVGDQQELRGEGGDPVRRGLRVQVEKLSHREASGPVAHQEVLTNPSRLVVQDKHTGGHHHVGHQGPNRHHVHQAGEVKDHGEEGSDEATEGGGDDRGLEAVVDLAQGAEDEAVLGHGQHDTRQREHCAKEGSGETKESAHLK